MKENNIKFKSMTMAIKAQKLLEKEKIKTKLEKVSNLRSLNGCGYQLIFKSQRDINKLLKQNGIYFLE